MGFFMHWMIDESKSFIYQTVPPKVWKLAVVGGAVLPYVGRKKWLKKHRVIKKGDSFADQDEKEICEVLDDMINCKVQGVLVVGDIGYASATDAEQLRLDLIQPLYSFADKEPFSRREVLKLHLDNLLGKGIFKFSIQEFYKIWSVLEVVVMLIQVLIGNLNRTRDVDLRKLKLIIDDQCKASLITLKEFVHFFVYSRSREGIFNCPPGTMNRIQRHLHVEEGKTYLNTNSLLNEILVGAHGSKMDNKHPELMVADLLSNFSRRALEGRLSLNIVEKLNKILKLKMPLQANAHIQDLIVNIPSQAEAAVRLLLGDKCIFSERGFLVN